MKKFVASGLCALASVFVTMLMLGTGLAWGTPPYYGQTFAKASATVKGSGGSPTIRTVVGSQLATDDCLVTNSQASITLNSSGQAAHSGTVLFDLNCNLVVAEPGKPGNSAASSDGAVAKKVKGFITYWNAGHPDSCTPGASAQWCQQMCDKYGGCSAEVVHYLSSNA